MSITKTVTVRGSDREWSGSFERYEKHRSVIDHWVRGGDVEMLADSGGAWVDVGQGGVRPFFEATRVYRKAARQPKAGEVWTVYGVPCVCCEKALFRIDGGKTYILGHPAAVFEAESLRSYFARKFFDVPAHAQWSTDDHEAYVYNAVKVAAK